MREQIVTEAHGWLEVPFKIGGSGRKGIDCSHLARKCLGAAGLKVVAWCDWLFLNMPAIKSLSLLEPGDLVFWRLKNNHPPNRLVRHVGIHVGETKVIHASSRAGKVIKSDYHSSDFDGLAPVEERSDELIQQWIKEMQKRPC